jgi:hypothetical protein
MAERAAAQPRAAGGRVRNARLRERVGSLMVAALKRGRGSGTGDARTPMAATRRRRTIASEIQRALNREDSP